MTRRHTPERLTLDAILPHLRTKRVSMRKDDGREFNKVDDLLPDASSAND